MNQMMKSHKQQPFDRMLWSHKQNHSTTLVKRFAGTCPFTTPELEALHRVLRDREKENNHGASSRIQGLDAQTDSTPLAGGAGTAARQHA